MRRKKGLFKRLSNEDEEGRDVCESVQGGEGALVASLSFLGFFISLCDTPNSQLMLSSKA